jgi:hypothetical protein
MDLDQRDTINSTITHVDGVLKTTKSVASLAKKNLENLTGADTYAYIVPDNFGVPKDQLSFTIYSKGPNTLTGVNLRFRNIINAFRDPEHVHFLKDALLEDVGTLRHSAQRPLTTTITPLVGPTPDWWIVTIDSQNATVSESLQIRKGKGQSRWAWRYSLQQMRAVVVPCPKGTTGNPPNNECWKDIALDSPPGWSDGSSENEITPQT